MCGGGGGYKAPAPAVIPEEPKTPEPMKNPERTNEEEVNLKKKRGKDSLKVEAAGSTGAGLYIPS